MTRTVVAIFDDYRHANDAVQELIDNNFARDQISYVASDASGDYRKELGLREDIDTSGAGVGAGIGATVGGIGGILVGLGALLIPGIGPIVAAGPLAAALGGLAGAGAGALAGGVLGALADLGIPNETGEYYAEGIRRGGTLVTIKVEDYQADQAVAILNRHNPINLRERAAQWRESGWTGWAESSSYDSVGMQRSTDRSVGMGATGGMGSDVRPGEYDAARRNQGMGSQGDVGQGRSSGQQPGGMGGTDTPVTGRGTFDAGERDISGTVSGRGTPESEMGTFNQYDARYTDYEDRFRSHFQSGPYSQTYTYTDYAPAYRYGYNLAGDTRFRGRNWADIENDARKDWDRQQPGTWDRFKDSIRHAWEEVKDTFD